MFIPLTLDKTDWDILFYFEGVRDEGRASKSAKNKLKFRWVFEPSCKYTPQIQSKKTVFIKRKRRFRQNLAEFPKLYKLELWNLAQNVFKLMDNCFFNLSHPKYKNPTLLYLCIKHNVKAYDLFVANRMLLLLYDQWLKHIELRTSLSEYCEF